MTSAPDGPHPWMIFANAIRLQVEPLEAIVKIGDTPVDIEEGLRARVWTVGVARTGNMIGLSAEDFAALAPAEQASRLENARNALYAAGAHEVIDAVADCESAVDAIEARIRQRRAPVAWSACRAACEAPVSNINYCSHVSEGG